MSARGEKALPPPFGSFSHQGIKAFYHHEKEMGSTTVSIETVAQRDMAQDSIERRRQILREEIAGQIMQWRLDRLVQETDGVLTHARIGTGEYLQQIHYSEVSAECKPEQSEQ